MVGTKYMLKATLKIPDPAHPTGYKDDALLLKVKATLKMGLIFYLNLS